MPAFAQYIGIDYSGAQTLTASLKGLRVYLAKQIFANNRSDDRQAAAAAR